MLLDLSSTSEWINTTKTIIQQIFPHEVIYQIGKIDHERMYSDTLRYITEAYEAEGYSYSREQLELELDRQYCSQYESIRCFHACRITDESSYRKRGIKRINDELFLELALERFGRVVSVEKIKKACKRKVFDDYDMSVFFFTVFEDAKDDSQNHYLKCGSEILQELACDLGLSEQGVLSGQGRSCIIECKIPISQVNYLYRFDFWRQLITFYFKESSKEVFKKSSLNLAFATDGDVTPESIINFHYVEDSDYEYRLLLH